MTNPRKPEKRSLPRIAKKPSRRRIGKKTSRGILSAAPKKPRGAPARQYSTKTIKTLFTLSGNRCAHPDCPNAIVVEGSPTSDAAVVGHICHIYAVANRGPRGKPGLTPGQRNAPENLILLCAHHHAQVDAQWQTYPARMLKQWKKAQEARVRPGTVEAIQAEGQIERHAFFEAASDETIEKALARLRAARSLSNFPTLEQTQILASQVEQSRYSSGSRETRARALAWCARLLAQPATLGRAKELLRKSRLLAATSEAAIAQAFITAITDVKAALAQLASIHTPAARSAALRLLFHQQGAQQALAWAAAAGLTASDFDSEGKFAYQFAQLEASDFAAARQTADAVGEADFIECPGLLHTSAMAHLATAVPTEFRAVVLAQVPLEADKFPLASTSEAWVERRRARALFTRLSSFARELGALDAANLASDFVLWLGLRDPATRDQAILELKDSMSDPAESLRRINLAIRFGLDLDYAALEARIGQNAALSGGGGAPEALARFAMVFTKEPKAAAEYLEKHRAQMYAHLPKPVVMGFEVEILARAGLLEAARSKLTEAIEAGLTPRDQTFMQSLLAELSGSDSIAERRTLYESTRDLRVLGPLVDAMAEAKRFQEMLPYAEKLFAASPSVEAYERVISCLNHLNRSDLLFQSLSAHSGLVGQSEYLKSIWAWTLYQEGRFSEAAAAEKALSDRDDSNARHLRVNIAVASGAWDELLEFCQETWNHRDRYSASELMWTAQISSAAKGPHSNDLVMAAAAAAPADARILVNAYQQATSAGWEQSPAVAAWLHAAANLSGEDGPLQTVSIKELMERKPEWDKQAQNIWEHLKTGKIPVFAAGVVLHRSLLEFYLAPSLLNPAEIDVRKRGIIFAYSGARQSMNLASLPATLGMDLAAIVTFARLGILDTVVAQYRLVVPHSTLLWLFQERQQATFHQPSRIKDAAAIKQLMANGTLRVLDATEAEDAPLAQQVGMDLAAMLASARKTSSPDAPVLVVRSAPLPRLGSLLSQDADIRGYERFLCSCSAVVDYLAKKGVLTEGEEQKARDYLKLHERPWPNEPTVEAGTELYLDALSVTYLQTAGVLGKLKAAGMKAFVSSSENQEANALLEIQTLGAQQLDYIEQIRRTLATGFTSGRVRTARATHVAEDDELFRLHPTYAALNLVTDADALVIDDRFVNQHPGMTHGGETRPLLSSLDVLDLLRASRVLGEGERFGLRTTLRQAGYQLIPVLFEELLYHLQRARIDQGQFLESAELRAIRESLSRARMSALVQLPRETPFLHQSLSAYIDAIKATWETTPDRAEAQVRADYLLREIDVRKWAPASTANARGFALYAYASFVLKLTSPPAQASNETRGIYFEWITTRLLDPIKDYQPEMYEWIVARSRELAIHAAEAGTRLYDKKRAPK